MINVNVTTAFLDSDEGYILLDTCEDDLIGDTAHLFHFTNKFSHALAINVCRRIKEADSKLEVKSGKADNGYLLILKNANTSLCNVYTFDNEEDAKTARELIDCYWALAHADEIEDANE